MNTRKYDASLLAVASAFFCLTGLASAQDGKVIKDLRPITLDGHTFQLNGRVIDPSPICLHDQDSVEESIKLAVIEGIPIMLGPGKSFTFKTAKEDDGRLFLVQKDGVLKLVGARTAMGNKDGKPVVINPLAGMTAEEMKQLWGVFIDYWDPLIAQKLKELDPKKSCVSITDAAAAPQKNPKEKKAAVPALPSNLQYLNVIEKGTTGFQDYSALNALSRLKLFSLVSYGTPKFDTACIGANLNMLFLDLSNGILAHPETLSNFTSLRYLNLSFCQNVTSLSFTKSMPQLLELEMYEARTPDLQPLSGHPNLQALRLSHSQVSNLPKGKIPNLRMLELLNSKVTQESIDAFQKAHPKCYVLFDLNRNFQQDVKNTARIKVRMGVTWFRPSEASEIFKVEDPEKVAAVLRKIKIDNSKPGLNCACSTGPFVEFFDKADRKIGVVAYRRGEQIEWLAGTIGNWVLAQESMTFLNKWLTENGAVVPKTSKAGTNKEQGLPGQP